METATVPSASLQSLRTLLESQHALYLNGTNDVNKTELVLHDKGNAALLTALEKKLDTMGFRGFSFCARGVHAIVMHTTQGQLLRIAVKGPDEIVGRPSHPAILEPLDHSTLTLSFKHGNIPQRRTLIIDVFPEVEVGNVSSEDFQLLSKVLEPLNLFPWDTLLPGNIGIIEYKGKHIPLLLDTGIIDHPHNAYRFDEDKSPKPPLAPWMDETGEWTQRKWLESIRREKGYDEGKGVIGVVPKKKLHQLEKTMGAAPPGRLAKMDSWLGIKSRLPRDSETIKALRKDGFYSSDIAELYARAYERIDPNQPLEFSKILKEERAKMKVEKTPHK